MVALTYFVSGAEGSRTPDLCSAIAALSQLSYSPNDIVSRLDGAHRARYAQWAREESNL